MSMVFLHHAHHIFSSSPIHPITITSNKKTEFEIRVCTYRICRRQGSFQTLETLLSLSPPHVSVNPSGCLGRCGAGPNLVVLPDPAIVVSHCGTPFRAARLMVDICGAGNDDSVARRSLDSLAFRKRAEIEIQSGNFSEAEDLFTLAVEAKPIGGVHVAYKGRSTVRLASGNFVGALEDAVEALMWHPQYAQAYICEGDAYLAMDQVEAAEKSYNMALECDRSLYRSKSFKTRIEKLGEKMTSTSMP